VSSIGHHRAAVVGAPGDVPAAEVTLPWVQPGGKLVTAALTFTKDDEGAI
jgi:hypothetical protein